VIKRIVIKTGPGTIEAGYPVSAQIGDEGQTPQVEIQARISPAPDLPALYSQWQQAYWQLGLSTRLEARDGITNVSSASDFEHCRALSRQLSDRIHHWLNDAAFRPVREKILEQMSPQDDARILLQTEDPLLQRIPWYELHFFERYRRAEVGICALDYQKVSQTPRKRTGTVRVLAILGNAAGLNTDIDRTLLSQLPNADIHFLREPSREVFNRSLWDVKGWDILFFAGHSSSRLGCHQSHRDSDNSYIEGSGELFLNATDKLTIPQLKHALQKAIERGLNTAIFNSCDGLGLAADLADLHIPQVLVMREPVPDKVAHAFLQGLLESFAGGNPFYFAVREAREKLQALEAKYPCATWLPVIVQNLAETPPSWRSLQGKLPPTPTALQNNIPSQLLDTLEENLLKRLNQVYGVAANATSPANLRQMQQVITGTQRWRLGIGAGVVAAIALLFGREFGLLERWELGAYDAFMRAKPTENLDSRLLIITNTDSDVTERPDPTGKSSMTDDTLLALLNKLKPLDPQLIGLDIYRDFAAKDIALANAIKTTDRLVVTCKVEDLTTGTAAIAPPPELNGLAANPDDVWRRIASTDFVYGYEPGDILRRQLLFLEGTPPCDPGATFSSVIALRYLKEGHYIPLSDEDINPADGLKIGSVTWPTNITKDFGGYHSLDTQGTQILLNYRRLKDPEQTKCGVVETPADCLTVGEFLAQSPEQLRSQIKDKIVLIGTTNLAFSGKDRWITPFTSTPSIESQVPGLFLQAQMISQLISAELDNRPLYRSWSRSREMAWIASWALLGGLLGAYGTVASRQGLLKLCLWLLLSEGVLLLCCWLWLFSLVPGVGGVWVPWIPSALALPAAAIAAQASQSIQRRLSPSDFLLNKTEKLEPKVRE
jgi:CHASE2 domain-containing sensor protein